MFIIYSDDTGSKGGGFDISKLDPVAMYLKHYDNYLFLSFILNKSKDVLEKKRASKELGMCEKKMEYWKHKVGFEKARMVSGVEERKKIWNETRKGVS